MPFSVEPPGETDWTRMSGAAPPRRTSSCLLTAERPYLECASDLPWGGGAGELGTEPPPTRAAAARTS
jgi:hypothetical protein